MVRNGTFLADILRPRAAGRDAEIAYGPSLVDEGPARAAWVAARCRINEDRMCRGALVFSGSRRSERHRASDERLGRGHEQDTPPREGRPQPGGDTYERSSAHKHLHPRRPRAIGNASPSLRRSACSVLHGSEGTTLAHPWEVL